MLRKDVFTQGVLENLLWFLVSLVLAFFVWVFANAQSDPIEERLFPQIPIQMEPDAGIQITNSPTRVARVRVRGQKSVLDLLTNDDIVVRADLTGQTAGTHVIELQTQVARRALVVDTQPTQITVTLENVEGRKVPVAAAISAEPQVEYEFDDPTFSANQVEASGVVSKVRQVAAAQVTLDLSEQRNPFEQELRLTPVDADGAAVDGVTLDPQSVRVQVNIRQRGDVRQVPVRPNILFDTLPQGYFLSSLSYAPQTVTLSGDLADIPGTLFTAPIDLTNRQSSFEITVPVEMPAGNVVVLKGQNITVSVGITAPTANRQFQNMAVEVIGLREGLGARLVPQVVTVLVTGPQPVLETLRLEEIRVVVDLNGLGVGNHEIVPVVSLGQGQIEGGSISILPTTINVEIASEPDATEEAPTPQQTTPTSGS